MFQALLEEPGAVHMLSIGRNDALATSPQLMELLLKVLQRGFIWACDFGELSFRSDVLELLVGGLERRHASEEQDKERSGPCTNLAFAFIDVGCGVSQKHVARVKTITKEHRMLDKALAEANPSCVGRRCAPWLDIDTVFGMVMRSENLTRCFWRPYQEPLFWRRAGFHCPKVQKPPGAFNKWVHPALRPLQERFHTGNLSADRVGIAFPPGACGLASSHALLTQCLHRAAAGGAQRVIALSMATTIASCATELPELWLCCDATQCERWHRVNAVLYGSWRQRRFTCKDFYLGCKTDLSSCKRFRSTQDLCTVEDELDLACALGCSGCKASHVVAPAVFERLRDTTFMCQDVGALC